MKKLSLIGVAFLIFSAAFPLSAEVVLSKISVTKDDHSFHAVLTNKSASAVARGYVAARFITPGREVPWITSWESSYFIPGGVEPEESHALNLPAPPEIAAIKGHDVIADVFFFSAFTLDGSPLNDDAVFAVEAIEENKRKTEELNARMKEAAEREMNR